MTTPITNESTQHETTEAPKARARSGSGTVSFHTPSGLFQARAPIAGRRMSLGYYWSEMEARSACKAALKVAKALGQPEQK